MGIEGIMRIEVYKLMNKFSNEFDPMLFEIYDELNQINFLRITQYQIQ